MRIGAQLHVVLFDLCRILPVLRYGEEFRIVVVEYRRDRSVLFHLHSRHRDWHGNAFFAEAKFVGITVKYKVRMFKLIQCVSVD